MDFKKVYLRMVNGFKDIIYLEAILDMLSILNLYNTQNNKKYF